MTEVASVLWPLVVAENSDVGCWIFRTFLGFRPSSVLLGWKLAAVVPARVLSRLVSMFDVVSRLLCGVCRPVFVGFGRGGDVVFEPAVMTISSSVVEERDCFLVFPKP